MFIYHNIYVLYFHLITDYWIHMCNLGKVEKFYALGNLEKQRKMIQNSNMIR